MGSVPVCLYDPERGEWIRLFDGFTLGQARGNAKFAVELENSHNHCAFRLAKGKVRLVDLGSPLGTRVNEQTVPPGGELELGENDRLRINGRDFYLTRWKVLPELQHGPVKPEAAEAPPEKSPSSPTRRTVRKPYIPVEGVRGASVGSGPGLHERALRVLEVAVTTLGARASGAWRLVLELKRLWEPALIAVFLLALFAAKFWGGHSTLSVESQLEAGPPLEHRDLMAVNVPLPHAPLEAKASPLPSQPLEPHGSIAARPLPDPKQGEQKMRLPVAQAEIPPRRLTPPSDPKIHRTFEVIPVGNVSGVSEVAFQSETKPAESQPEPEKELQPADTDSGHFRITAISVMGPDSRQAQFEEHVSPGTILAAYDRMNREPAAGSAALSGNVRIFDLPHLERDGQRYLLDWCLTWEQSCGKLAADAFCREMGLTAAEDFRQAQGYGNAGRPTAIIGQPGVFCPGNSPGHPCDAFSYIKCR